MRYEYTYNSEGSLVQLKDLLSGVTYRYIYDMLGRPVRVSTSEGFGIELKYDTYNRTSDVQFIYNNTQLKTTWRYGDSWGMAEKNGVIYGVKYNGAERLCMPKGIIESCQFNIELNWQLDFFCGYELLTILILSRSF